MIQIGNQSYAAAQAAIARTGRDRMARIDGPFCTTDLMVLGALYALRFDLGLNLLEDIQAEGFDDIEQAGWAAYLLTTIRPDIAEQCTMVLELLTARIDTLDQPPQLRGDGA